MARTGAQVAPAQEAGRAQPQTTIEPPGGPFIQHAAAGVRTGYQHTGVTLGSMITDPIPAAPGYLRGYQVRLEGTGGLGTATAAVSAADNPWNVVTYMQAKDAFGTVLLAGGGFEMLKCVPKYGAQYGLHALSDPANLPSFSQVASTGNFVLHSFLPFEFVKGQGLISAANAALLPQLTWQLNPTPYGTAPGTLPTVSAIVDQDFYWLPEGVAVEPPSLGTTAQWVQQTATPGIGSNASNLAVSLPRLGGYLTSLVFILRDSTGARIDPFSGVTNPRFRIKIDGVPVYDSLWTQHLDRMQIQHAGVANASWTRDTGVWSWTRKTSMSHEILGLLDTGETFLSTNPGTLVEIEAPNWGTVSNAPANLTVLACQVVPAGSLVTGLPEL